MFGLYIRKYVALDMTYENIIKRKGRYGNKFGMVIHLELKIVGQLKRMYSTYFRDLKYIIGSCICNKSQPYLVSFGSFAICIFTSLLIGTTLT